MMLFMLHHMDTFAQQEELLADACRVARRRLLLLEDTAVGPVDRVFNRAWDYALNAPRGVPTPFTFRSTDAWRAAVEQAGFSLAEVRTFRGTWPILRSYTQTVLVADTRAPR